jgi:hypothetical protein
MIDQDARAATPGLARVHLSQPGPAGPSFGSLGRHWKWHWHWQATGIRPLGLGTTIEVPRKCQWQQGNQTGVQTLPGLLPARGRSVLIAHSTYLVGGVIRTIGIWFQGARGAGGPKIVTHEENPMNPMFPAP